MEVTQREPNYKAIIQNFNCWERIGDTLLSTSLKKYDKEIMTAKTARKLLISQTFLCTLMPTVRTDAGRALDYVAVISSGKTSTAGLWSTEMGTPLISLGF